MDNRDNSTYFFGIPVLSKLRKQDVKNTPASFAPPMDNDGAAVVETNGNNSNLYSYGVGGFMASAINVAGPIKDEIMAIRKYRQMATHHDCDFAIDNIVNDAIVQMEEGDQIVWLNTDKLTEDYPSKVIDAIHEEFENVLDILDFNNLAYDIFRSWYVDGRLYYHKIYDTNAPQKGLIAVRRIDPVLMKKVRRVKRKNANNDPDVKIIEEIEEFFVFNEQGGEGTVAAKGMKIDPDAITFVHSGQVDPISKTIVSYMDKAYRPLNQVRMMEDCLVVYRMARAPDRRVFNVDVGTMDPRRAEQFVKDQMNQYRNRLVYDASTGKINDDAHHMHIMEDFWFPKSATGSGTTVDTLQGGANLGQMEDVQYFQEQLYRSLNVPLSRLQSEQSFMQNRQMEITRDELLFIKFIRRLQKRFSFLFVDLLRTQLILKRVVTPQEWNKISKKLFVEYAEDSTFAYQQEMAELQDQVNILTSMQQFIGSAWSMKWVRNNVLKQTDEQVEQILEEIAQERVQKKRWLVDHPDEIGKVQDMNDNFTFFGEIDYSNKDMTEPELPKPEVEQLPQEDPIGNMDQSGMSGDSEEIQ